MVPAYQATASGDYSTRVFFSEESCYYLPGEIMLSSRFLCSAASRQWRRSFLHSDLFSYRTFQKHNYAKRGHDMNSKLVEKAPSHTANLHSWRIYTIPASLLVFAGIGIIMLRDNDERRAILKGSRESAVSGESTISRLVIGGSFQLFDMEDRMVTESDLRGNWVLLYFGYTSSPDVGPAEVEKMVKVIRILESKHNLKVMPVFITIDPQRDSSEQLRAYLKEFDSKIIGLTGPIASIRQIAHQYRVYFKKVDEQGQDYLVATSHNMYLLDPNAEILRCFGVEYDARQLAEDIATEVNKADK